MKTLSNIFILIFLSLWTTFCFYVGTQTEDTTMILQFLFLGIIQLVMIVVNVVFLCIEKREF